MDTLSLMRERAELRNRLDSAADQIGQLQASIAKDSRVDDDLWRDTFDPTPWSGAHEHGEQPETQIVSELREELVQALRDNDLLRQAIGKSNSKDLQSVVGHRTVSSTQLASATRPALSAQQRWEVQDMVRRQEILRRSQADAFEEQIKTLKREREEAQHKLQEAEGRSNILFWPLDFFSLHA